jgi:flavin reductase (DIM6/NTAB) family NADH-FMN oxidoreductase RutF
MAAPSASVSADAYRTVMRLWPSGVSIITMLDGDRPHGMTASAFTSVSIHPPLVVIVVDQRWRSHDYIKASGAFCVNILGADQQDWSDRFAGRQGAVADRFAGIAKAVAVTGAPVLRPALGFLDCQVDQAVEAGDHTLFVGRVVACEVHDPVGRPLIYHNTDYATLAPRAPA